MVRFKSNILVFLFCIHYLFPVLLFLPLSVLFFMIPFYPLLWLIIYSFLLCHFIRCFRFIVYIFITVRFQVILDYFTYNIKAVWLTTISLLLASMLLVSYFLLLHKSPTIHCCYFYSYSKLSLNISK